LGHILAGAVIISGTLLFTLVCYFFGLATSSYGIDTPAAVIPEFLALMFMASVFAVAVSTGAFILSTLFQWLRSKWHFPVWLPLIIVPPLTFLVTLLVFGRARGLEFAALVTGMSFLFFSIYWTLFVSSGAVLDFIRHKLSKEAAT
jgi:hypothetical protein